MGYFMGYIIAMHSLRPDASEFSFVLLGDIDGFLGGRIVLANLTSLVGATEGLVWLY